MAEAMVTASTGIMGAAAFMPNSRVLNVGSGTLRACAMWVALASMVGSPSPFLMASDFCSEVLPV